MTLLALGFLFLLIFAGVHIASTLGLLSYVLSEAAGMPQLSRAVGSIAWSANTDFILIAVPIFILMGQLLLHAGIADGMYRSLAKWLTWLPGGLMHTNIATSAMFAATSGSSVATAATIGTVAIPNIAKHGYNPPLFLGSVAAGGTLGILIPPSITLMVYGVIAEKSVVSLYFAALIPGILLSLIFSLVILVLCLARPEWGGASASYTMGERFRDSIYLLPPLALFLIVVGTIYGGIATPTEAASLGLMATLAIAAYHGGLTLALLKSAFLETVRTSCMVMLIIVASVFLNFVMVSVGLIETISQVLLSLDLSPVFMMGCIVLFYVLLGCVMEALSMLIATTPIVLPVVVALGYDPIWFGVVLVIVIEAALITPPVGVNLFVVQSVRAEGDFKDVVIGAFPFLLGMLLLIGLLIAFPSIALWLPSTR